MKLFNYSEIDVTGGFLFKKQEMNRKVTINSVYDRFFETGRIKAFDCSWKEGQPQRPHHFWDSDVAKWMEGASYILRKNYSEDLEDKIEDIIDKIEKNQGEDGYFNIYYTVCEPEKRFTNRDMHELYCAGHLFEAAVAYDEVTGRKRFLDCMEKYAGYIYKVFVEEKIASFITPGHEEIELSLVKMYRHTGKKKYLELAEFFLNERGVHDFEYDVPRQSTRPVRDIKEAEGHAVRAGYLYSAMADVAYETGDKELRKACETVYDDIVEKKMYVTGGIGSTCISEAFTKPYDLPNDTAYAETCAAISLMMFSARMLQFENKSKYSDVIERIFYNGFLSGVSVDGKSFFYENPLEITLANKYETPFGRRRFPITQRLECFNCSCCPPNVNRVLPKISEYVFGEEDGVLFINQYCTSTLKTEKTGCSMITDYPVNGDVKIKAEKTDKVAIRIPSWCDNYVIDKNYEIIDGYAYIENDGTEININFDMTPFAVKSDSRIVSDVNKVCIQAGPVVYCAEGVDNGNNLHTLSVKKDFECKVDYNKEFLLNELEISAYRTKDEGKLYSKGFPTKEETKIKLIPYSCFANRGETDMLVWLNTAE